MTDIQDPSKTKRATPLRPLGASALTVLTGDETVDGLVERYPALRLTLMSYGLCTCCSGSLTLRQSAAARGIPLGTVLSDLTAELAKSA